MTDLETKIKEAKLSIGQLTACISVLKGFVCRETRGAGVKLLEDELRKWEETKVTMEKLREKESGGCDAAAS